MAAPFTLIGIDHVVLRAADPAALERFYMEVLGCAFEKRQGSLAQLRAGQALIDIVPADEAGPAQGRSSSGGANLDHLCLRIAPFDASAIVAHLAAHGVSCGEERRATVPRARARRSTCTIPKATASSSRARCRDDERLNHDRTNTVVSKP